MGDMRAAKPPAYPRPQIIEKIQKQIDEMLDKVLIVWYYIDVLKIIYVLREKL